jgi:hypothetical protein
MMKCAFQGLIFEGTMSKPKLWFGICAMSLAVIGDAAAADLSRGPVVRKDAVVVESQVECVRWVRQNQSWYNYCDPVPHFARTAYGDYWWDHRWYGYKGRWYN